MLLHIIHFSLLSYTLSILKPVMFNKRWSSDSFNVFKQPSQCSTLLECGKFLHILLAQSLNSKLRGSKPLFISMDWLLLWTRKHLVASTVFGEFFAAKTFEFDASNRHKLLFQVQKIISIFDGNENFVLHFPTDASVKAGPFRRIIIFTEMSLTA